MKKGVNNEWSRTSCEPAFADKKKKKFKDGQIMDAYVGRSIKTRRLCAPKRAKKNLGGKLKNLEGRLENFKTSKTREDQRESWDKGGQQRFQNV
jgi:hypothetical protein